LTSRIVGQAPPELFGQKIGGNNTNSLFGGGFLGSAIDAISKVAGAVRKIGIGFAR
jgi:hypothetical protein